MKCPFCREGCFAVLDTRSSADDFPVRRRRRCDRCGRTVWTTEVLEQSPLKIAKKDGSREPFDPMKLRRGLETACYKRPISADQLEGMVRRVEAEVFAAHHGEVAASELGELVMKYLRDLDQVAYVRFASVYREFQDVSDFVHELEPMLGPKTR